jgi:hypothetical protein
VAEGLRVADLLPDRLDGAAEEARKSLCGNEEIGRMSLAWGYIGDQLEGALHSALDCDLLELFGKGWASAKLLADYADPEKHPPGERSVVELGAHDFGRDLHPIVAVTIGSCPCIELKFTFAVTAHFGGLRLTIGDGHILAGATGDAWTSAQLSYNGVPLHEAAESRKLALPGQFSFASPGIAIGLARPAGKPA